MELLISAIHKLVIKDVVKYSEEKVETTKDVIKSRHTYNYHNFESLSEVAEERSNMESENIFGCSEMMV